MKEIKKVSNAAHKAKRLESGRTLKKHEEYKRAYAKYQGLAQVYDANFTEKERDAAWEAYQAEHDARLVA